MVLLIIKEKKMKAIKIVEKNRESIEKAMAVANGRAQYRLAFASDVEAYVKKVEQSLEKLGLPKKLWTGMKFECMPCSEDLPKAYFKASHGSAPSATSFDIERKATGWFFLGAGRYTFYKRCDLSLLTKFTEEQKQAIIDHAYKF